MSPPGPIAHPTPPTADGVRSQDQDKCLHPDTPTHYLGFEKHTMFTNNIMCAFFHLFQVDHFTNPACTCTCTCIRMFWNIHLMSTVFQFIQKQSSRSLSVDCSCG